MSNQTLPSLQTNQKIEKLQRLRAKISLARYDYRVAPTISKEIALRDLVRQEEDLSADVGFGDHPDSPYGRPKR